MQDAGCSELRRDHGLIASPCRDGIIQDKDEGAVVFVGGRQECKAMVPSRQCHFGRLEGVVRSEGF